MRLSKSVYERVARIAIKSSAIIIDLGLLAVVMILAVEWPDALSLTVLAAAVVFSSINIWTLLLNASAARKTSLVINALMMLGAAAFALGSLDHKMISRLEAAAIFILMAPPVMNCLAIYVSRTRAQN
jgi:hypothetical protein